MVGKGGREGKGSDWICRESEGRTEQVEVGQEGLRSAQICCDSERRVDEDARNGGKDQGK